MSDQAEFLNNKKNHQKLLSAEIFFGVVVFSVLGVFLTRYAGGPVTSDEVMYINHGLMNIRDPFIINRYTHIYFQKLFMALADTPLDGVRAYWGFLVASLAALTYAISRMVTKRSNPIHGVLSTLLFLSIPLLVVYSGNTTVDITAGFFISLLVFLFILYFRLPTRPAYLLVVMGLVFFLAFRTKETTLSTAVLFIGFLFNEDGKIDLRCFLKRIGFFLIGILAGVALFIVLNGIFLNDPWFGLRLKEYSRFNSTYIQANIGDDSKPIANWFTDYLLDGLLYIFVAYLLSGVIVLRQEKTPLRLPWMVPLALTAILSIIIGFSPWVVIPRYAFPVVGLLCALAPQLIVFEPPKLRKEWLWFTLSLIIAMALFLIGRRLLVKASLHGPYYYPDFLASTVYPLTLIGLILLAFLFKKYSVKTVFLPLLVFIIFIAYPLYYNSIHFFIVQTNTRKMHERLLVVEAFDGKINLQDDNRILVLEGGLYYMNYSSRDIEFIDLFNMFHNARLTTDDVLMTNKNDLSSDFLKEWQPDFILMSADEFASTRVNAIVTSYASGDFKFFDSENHHFVLFSRTD